MTVGSMGCCRKINYFFQFWILIGCNILYLEMLSINWYKTIVTLWAKAGRGVAGSTLDRFPASLAFGSEQVGYHGHHGMGWLCGQRNPRCLSDCLVQGYAPPPPDPVHPIYPSYPAAVQDPYSRYVLRHKKNLTSQISSISVTGWSQQNFPFHLHS